METQKGKGPHEIQKNLNASMKTHYANKGMQPINQSDARKITTVNELRRYIYDHSVRERIFLEAGNVPVPADLLDRPYPEVVQWARDWREKVFQNSLSTRNVELEKCHDCGLLVRKGDHKCFVVKSRQVTYKGGLPYNKATQVVAKGDRIVTRTRKALDVNEALSMYDRIRDKIPNAPKSDDGEEGQGRKAPTAEDHRMEGEAAGSSSLNNRGSIGTHFVNVPVFSVFPDPSNDVITTIHNPLTQKTFELDDFPINREVRPTIGRVFNKPFSPIADKTVHSKISPNV
jgi:hypothetical protein